VRSALGPKGRSDLLDCARRGALLAFDFDGTLAPIVAEPGRAAMRRRTRLLLAALARRLDCLVLSGRAPADLRSRLAGVRLVEVVGNHGTAFALTPARRAAARARARRWSRSLASQLEGRPGLELEDNGVSLAVHFRAAPDQADARRTVHRAVARLAGARALDGKCVVNVLPARSAHKGGVLRRIARARGDEAVLYVGDDRTDEDAFRARVAPRYVTVRVGRTADTAARYVLDDQRGIDALLALLLSASRRRARPAP